MINGVPFSPTASSGDPAVVAALQAADAALDQRVTDLEQAGPGPGGASVFIDVRSHGASGDGATDDTAALQAAFDAAAAALASGAAATASVYVPAGSYVTDPVFANTSNITVFGDGRGASVLKRKAGQLTNVGSLGVLNFHGSSEARLSDVTVRDLGADGNKSNMVVAPEAAVLDVECFSFAYVDRPHVERCLGRNSNSEAFDFDYCADGNIVDSVSIDCDGNGVHFSLSSVRMRGRGCRSFNCGSSVNNRGGFDVHQSASDCGYVDCHALGCYRGFVILGHKNQLSGCTATSSQHTGIRVEGNYNAVSGCAAEGTFAGNGVTITGVGNSFAGGTYRNNQGHGLTGVSGALNNTVTAIVSTGNGSYGLSWSSGANKNIVAGCQLSGNLGALQLGDSGTGNVSSGNVIA